MNELHNELYLIDVIALCWFIGCWVGYTVYAIRKGRTVNCLAGELHHFRMEWMRNVLKRENRVPDTTIIANMERTLTFFASSSMLVVAGLLTVLASTDRAIAIISTLPYATQTSSMVWELKLLALILIFIYAFFKFSWALRQVGFCSVLLGSAPLPQEKADADKQGAFVDGAARVFSLAGSQYNLGLRAFYFAQATLSWFINPYLFMLLTAVVVLVLYRREFHSDALRAMLDVRRADSSYEP